MTNSARKAWIYLLLTFLLGVASGAVSGYAYGRKTPDSAPHVDMVRKFFTQRLQLTPEQLAQLKPAFDSFSKSRRSIESQNSEIFNRVHAQIEAVLTPDQKVKLCQLDKERADRNKHGRNDNKTNRVEAVKRPEKTPADMP